ncbi:MAG: hypothetical protein IKI69_07150 [Oscillospiraceae bacterium]|nr:hypothetical protein [Oscillospiraceae bacterium]
MKYILTKKYIVLFMAIMTMVGLFNGHYQATTIEIKGISGSCYGTLLSREPGSGPWNTREDKTPSYAPDHVKKAFKEYKDPDGYYYFNYFEDVERGLLRWDSFPPEDFKLLLYFEETDTFMSTEVAHRYSLTSPFEVRITEEGLILNKNYDYPAFLLRFFLRVLISAGIAILISLFYCKRYFLRTKCFIISNVAFHVMLNLFISFFSYYRGFTVVEYVGILWAPYMIFLFVQFFLYRRISDDIQNAFMIAITTDLVVYGTGIILIDVFPKLFM